MKRLAFALIPVGGLLVALLVLIRPVSKLEETVASSTVTARLPIPNATNPVVTNVAAVVAVPFKSPAMVVSRLPEAVSAFSTWAEQYLAGDASANTAQGVALAWKRREAMLELIENNPERALALAVPYAWRLKLPPAITRYFEERVDARGDFTLMMAEDFRQGTTKVFREVVIGGKRYDAFVYGRRSKQKSQTNLPLHGIALEGKLALSDDPIRQLDTNEAVALEHERNRSATQVCGVCSRATDSSAHGILADLGGETAWVCGPEHLQIVMERWVMAEGGSNGGTYDIAAGGAGLWTRGPKDLLYIRVNFPDDLTEPLSETSAYDIMDSVNEYFALSSYNSIRVTATVTPLLTLPGTKSYYTTEGAGALFSDARKVAFKAGYDTANYELDIVSHTTVPGFDWGGLGVVGGKGTWLQSYGAGVTSHELGHNLGLWHAHFWNTTNYSSIGPGTNIEYGNIFDTMGSAAAGNNHFGAAYKHQLDWLPASAIHNVASNGVYRIYPFDAPERIEGRAYAARVTRDFSQNYWLEFRRLFTGNPWLQQGVLLNREHGDAEMIDTTPGTPPERVDSAVVVGRTFTDAAMGIHITPLRRGATDTDPFLEVQVNVGDFPSNQPPELKVEMDPTNAAPGQLVHFHATASDPEGELLAYSWFGTTWANDDPGIFSTNNVPWTFRSWTGAGERVLRCVVSDMKGGVASANVVVPVGVATGSRISGVVLDERGEPVEGVRVDNGVTNSPESYVSGYTDSHGRYVIVGLTGELNLEAVKPGFTFTNYTWTNPVIAGPLTARGVDFVAIPIPQVTLSATTNTAPEAGGAWQFTLTRTGSTSNDLVLGLNLSGTAGGTDYSAMPTLAAGSNSVTIPADTNSLTFSFAVINDINAEGNETVTLTIFDDPAEAFYVPRRGAVTVSILDNDLPALPQVSVAAMAEAIPENGADSALLVFTRTGATNSNLTVNYTVSGSTATAGGDFPTPLGVLIIPAGSSRATVAIPPLDDKDVESDENIVLSILPNATYSVGNGSATVTLLDDDLLTVTIAPTGSGLTEPNGAGRFTVKRDGDLTANVAVYYSVSGTASNGADFISPSNVVTIPAGLTSADISVNALDDVLVEGDETVTLTLVSNPGYNIGTPGKATLNLRDNEKVPVNISAGDASASEPGDDFGQITISRAGGTTGDLVVYLIISGTAIPGADYVPIDNPVVIPSGAAAVTLDVIPFDDLHVETNETVLVQIAPNTNYTFTSSSPARVNIEDDDPNNVPAVGFSAPASSAPENESPGIPVSLSFTSASPITVSYRVIGGTASSADYTLPPGGMSFSPGELTKILPLPITEDNTNEPNETIRITLYDPMGATHDAHKIHTYTIVDNEAGTVSITATANGSEIGPTPGNFRITRAGNTNASILVNFQVAGTATAPGDYVSLSNSVTIPAGATNLDLPVIPLADGTVELDETVVLTLTSAPGATLAPSNKATVTITDGTPNNLPVVTITSTNSPYAVEGSGQGAFVFTRTGSTTGALALYLTFFGTADNGADCTAVTNVISLPVGQASVTVPVMATDDALIEGEETLIAALTQRDTYRIAYPADATVTIQDNDQNVRIDASDFESAEPGFDLGEFTFTRFGTTNTPLTVFYSISGTASNGLDYSAITNSFAIPAGKLAATLPILPLDDLLVEGHETVRLTLLTNSNYSLTLAITGTVTILDDEPSLSIVAVETNVVEGSRSPGRFTVIRGGNPDYSLTAHLGVSGTAAYGADYLAFVTNVYFPCGVTGMDLLISPTNELVVESSETVTVRLLADSAYSILSPTNATIIVLDAGTNQNPRVTITSPTVATVFLPGANVNMILEATVADDSDTNSPVTLTWTNVAGPFPVEFGNTDQTNNTVSFANDGVYVLRLTTDDGHLTDYAEVTVVVDTLVRLSTNLLHWTLDDGGGTKATDNSGNGRDGTIIGTSNWTTNGARAGALGLNGAGASVRPTTNTAFLNDLRQFSLGLWVKPAVTNTDLGILAANEGSTNSTFALYSTKTADCGNGSNVFTAVLPASKGVIRHVSASNATSNDWVHLALTWSNGLAPALFVNGSPDQPLAHFVALSRFLTNCTQFILGQSPRYTPNSWNGFFDDVRVFQRALHPAEVLALSATNLAPVVSVPTNVTVQILTPAPLPAAVSDDGQPLPPGALSLMWTQASGPVSITLTNPTALTNHVEFVTPGTYVFRLIADDGQVKIYDDLNVTVTEPTQVNVFVTDGDAAELGPDPGEFTFSRAGDTNFDLTIQIAISGIASNGMDFLCIPLTNVVTIPAGVESLTAPLVPFLDHRTEGDETFTYSIISNVAYTIGSSPATVVIHDSPYGMWNVAHFTLEELTDPTLIGEEVDFDHDGQVNFAEYAVNRDPKLPESTSPLTVAIEHDPNDDRDHITITYQRRVEPTDTSYQVVVSNDLLIWNSGTNYVQELSATNDGNGLTETVKAQLTAPWPNGTNQFVTVRVWLRATGP